MDLFAEEVTTPDLTTRYIGQTEKAFLNSVQDLADEINVDKLDERIQAFDIEGAINEIGIDESAFSALELVFSTIWFSAIAVTYQAMRTAGSALRGIRSITRQDNEMVNAYANLVHPLIGDLVEQQRGAVTGAILSGISSQKRTREIALDIAGRFDRTAGRRVGGLIGLNNRQADLYAKIEQGLKSGDKSVLRDYLKLKTRDMRYDTWVRSALEGASLSSGQQQTILSRLSDRNLYNRAKLISEDVTRMILAAAQDEMLQRQIRSGKISADLLTKVWHDMNDRVVRHTHRKLGGTEVAYGENFISVSGATLRYPHDPLAPRNERVGCRCWLEYRYNGKRIGRSGFRGF